MDGRLVVDNNTSYSPQPCSVRKRIHKVARAAAGRLERSRCGLDLAAALARRLHDHLIQKTNEKEGESSGRTT